jgi:hypothetical protein
MRVIALLLLLLTMLPAGASRGYVVGNGGDGIEINGRLVLADLVAHGLEDRALLPEGKPSLEMYIAAANAGYPRGFPVMKFARKLEELESRMPGLAGLVLLAYSRYNWRSTSSAQEGGFSDDDLGSEFWSRFHGRRRQLAWRFQNEIYLLKPEWERLDDQNKIALVFHESLSGLLRLKPAKPGADQGMRRRRAYIQSTRALAHVVAAMMDPSRKDLETAVRQELRVPGALTNWRTASLSLSVFEGEKEVYAFTLPVSAARSPAQLGDRLSAFCESQEWSQNTSLQAHLPKSLPVVKFFSYPSRQAYKYGLQAGELSAGQIFAQPVRTAKDCAIAAVVLRHHLELN